MKFALFMHEGERHWGVVEGEELVQVESPGTRGREMPGPRYPLSTVKLLPPATPSKVVCIGQNYLEHIREIGVAPPDKPVFFLKPPSCVIGPGDSIILPRTAQRVDYEGELAIIIRETMKDVPEARALEYVLGYSCFNDVTERSLVASTPFNLTISKSFDTFGPIGPFLETDIDPNNACIETYLNGILMQHDNTKNCLFSVQYLLHYLSECMTLCPGDVVTTGTPKGIAPMRPGDVVEVVVEGIGRLSNPVEAVGEVQES